MITFDGEQIVFSLFIETALVKFLCSSTLPYVTGFGAKSSQCQTVTNIGFYLGLLVTNLNDSLVVCALDFNSAGRESFCFVKCVPTECISKGDFFLLMHTPPF